MFSDCTSLVIAPGLPATKLVGGCYSRMFQRCISLRSGPDLPATELAPYCYYDMLIKCYRLNSVRLGYTGTAAEAPEQAFGGDDGSWAYDANNNGGILYYTGTDPDPITNFGFASDWTHQPY